MPKLKNILVTGGAGFIGSNFVGYFLDRHQGSKIINLDALTYSGSKENLNDLAHSKRHKFIHGDIRDIELLASLFEDHQVDTVVHFAAESHVDRSIDSPDVFVQSNVNGTVNLLNAARAYWLGEQKIESKDVRFHHVSTDEVYGSLGKNEPAFTESTPYDPNSPYAASKAASDHFVRSYATTYGMPITISNCSNNYGPKQYPEKLIPLVILNATNGFPLPVYGDGLQVRDWLFVEDHCEAVSLILEEGRIGETYNIGGDVQPTNLEIIIMLCEILDERLPASDFRPHAQLIEHVQDRPGHDRRYAMDIAKISAELDWHPRHNLREGLEFTVDWYLNNKAWIEKIRSKENYKDWVQKNYDKRERPL